jgi:DNA-binding transcriptional regulator YiaG
MKETLTSEVERLARVQELCASGEARMLRGGVSAAAVARAARTSHVSILRWERGDRVPNSPEALRYLDVLEALAKVRTRSPAASLTPASS